ncbi:MAG TPA: hypothetical protein VFW25_14390 [Silvibacterium sp.]|nr:hypothetical protein [Silvibacterium sp.]
MNRYLLLHRIKAPVMLVVFGITAMLDQWGILPYHESWPLYLIAWGSLQLAERAAWTQLQRPAPYAAQPGSWGGPASAASAPPPGSAPTAITPPDEGRR